MNRFIDIIDGIPAGSPYPRPARIKLSSGHTVGCIHWPDSEFLQYGKAPVEGAADTAIEVETGYIFDAGTGIAAPVIEARPLAEVQAEAVAEVKAQAFQFLQPTDWRVIRQAEGGDALDEATASYRAAVRQASNEAETALANAQTPAAVRTVVEAVEWPQPSESEE